MAATQRRHSRKNGYLQPIDLTRQQIGRIGRQGETESDIVDNRINRQRQRSNVAGFGNPDRS